MDQGKEEILKQEVIEVEKPKQTLAEKLKAEKKKKRKKTIIWSVVLSFVAFISYSVYWLFKPYMAYADYGICKTFVELNVSYPHTIEVNEMSYTRDGSMRMWYTHIDAFGEFRMEQFVCSFEYDQAGNVSRVKNVKIGKVNMDAEKLEHLNNALPYFYENPVILAWPYVADSLTGVTFDFNALRKIQFDPKK